MSGLGGWGSFVRCGVLQTSAYDSRARRNANIYGALPRARLWRTLNFPAALQGEYT